MVKSVNVIFSSMNFLKANLFFHIKFGYITLNTIHKVAVEYIFWGECPSELSRINNLAFSLSPLHERNDRVWITKSKYNFGVASVINLLLQFFFLKNKNYIFIS